ncbi:SET domain-containing protein [Prosthecobacter sp.]|uniref:SET domain-containing protein n=1 Tax=Prosthecobacter sp. TaxID=1965333 RepID=UPI0025D90AD6|nr:SET domain-containing protein [Prosthecobacter sp.]
MSDTDRPNIEIKSAGCKGQGVFATRALPRGCHIYTLSGRRMTLLQIVVGIVASKIRNDDPLQIGRFLYLDLDAISNKFNHSCDPNCAIMRDSDLVTRRDIMAGEELTFDYSLTVRPSFYSWMWHMSCQCGSVRCRKRIGDISSVPHNQVEESASDGLLQNYMIEHLSKTKKSHG